MIKLIVLFVIFFYSLVAIASSSGKKTGRLNGSFKNKVVKTCKDGIETTIEDGSSALYPKSRVRDIYEMLISQ